MCDRTISICQALRKDVLDEIDVGKHSDKNTKRAAKNVTKMSEEKASSMQLANLCLLSIQKPETTNAICVLGQVS